MATTSQEMEAILPRFIARHGLVRLNRLRHPQVEQVIAEIKEHLGVQLEVDASHFYPAIWALVRRGLAYLTMEDQAPSNWGVGLTVRGHNMVRNAAITPEDPTGYMERLLREVPDTSDVVKMYLQEALHSYVEGCYLASTVMLGVAAEACMLDTAEDYVRWAGKRADKLREFLANPRTFYIPKLQEFQKRLSVDKPLFPPDLGGALQFCICLLLR
jgi:hypothetical protein